MLLLLLLFRLLVALHPSAWPLCVLFSSHAHCAQGCSSTLLAASVNDASPNSENRSALALFAKLGQHEWLLLLTGLTLIAPVLLVCCSLTSTLLHNVQLMQSLVCVCRGLSRVPSTSRGIQSRLEVILQLIAQLMSVVQLQQNTLLPMLRVACQTLTVQGLDLLQIKAAGSATLQSYDTPHRLSDH